MNQGPGRAYSPSPIQTEKWHFMWLEFWQREKLRTASDEVNLQPGRHSLSNGSQGVLKVWKWPSLIGFYEPLTKHVFCQARQPDTEFPRQDSGGQEGAGTFIAPWRQEEKLQKLARNAWPAICSSVCSEIFSVALWPGLIFLMEALSDSGCAYLTV